MKKILLVTLIAILAMANVQAETTNVEMCKTFIAKAKAYQETMKDDEVSKATLAFYKDEVVGQCGNIASKMSYEKNFFAEALMKKDTTTVNNCKLSIKMAKAYAETTDQSFIITHAHKVNVADNCGTLVAKKASEFCFFDVVQNKKENKKEDLKERCLASIEKAHAYTASMKKNPETLQSHKNEVVANCGKLQANL